MTTKHTLMIIMGLLTASVAHAVTLVPDTPVFLPGATFVESGAGGAVIEDDLVDFSLSNGVTGQVQNRVVRKADNTLVFFWRVIRTDTVSSAQLTGFRLGEFVVPSYEANWKSDGIGTRPANFGYLLSTGNGYVNFSFQDTFNGSGGLLAQESSRFFYLDTDVTEYEQTAIYDLVSIDGGNTEISGLFSTFNPVPEPATISILGLAALAALRKRKTKS